MSRHHRAQHWTSHTAKLRAVHAAALPSPCIECGRPVLPGTQWHVGHRRGAMFGGEPTVQNTGPAHARCNMSSGGRLGARVANAARTRTATGRRAW